ncbi:MAG: hypothetical protein DMF95_21890 [Acidobacteria bacterium]|nr:MAG: hypothetical protein DMF95_21890 [Acidobacteriota bacterium]
MPALMAATLFGDAAMVDVLLRHGADANRPGAAGATALMWAVPNPDKVRLLLDRGANVNARSDTGRTALLVAAAFPGTGDLLRLLLDRGADLRAQDGCRRRTFFGRPRTRSNGAFAPRAPRGICPLRSPNDGLLDLEGIEPVSRRARHCGHVAAA